MDANLAEMIRLAKAGRRAERRGAAIRRVIQASIVAMILALINGWVFMLMVGVAHEHWWPAVPTIGYWWAVLLAWGLHGAFTGAAKAAKS